MPDDLASSNVNRAYSMAGTSIAIFTFMLVFLYPRFASGELDPLLFQSALVVMGVATFSAVLTAYHYYGASLKDRFDEAQRIALARRGDRLWVVGYSLLFLAPALILFGVGLVVVGAVWLGLWLGYLLFTLRFFPRVRTPGPSH
jgi:hypothetical protein